MMGREGLAESLTLGPGHRDQTVRQSPIGPGYPGRRFGPFHTEHLAHEVQEEPLDPFGHLVRGRAAEVEIDDDHR